MRTKSRGPRDRPARLFYRPHLLDERLPSGDSTWDAAPSGFLTVVSGLATAQIILWLFDLPGRGFGQRPRVVVASFCLGGVLVGESLGWLWVLDGTLGAGTFADVIIQGPLMALAAFAYALIPGIVGAVFGLVVGLGCSPSPLRRSSVRTRRGRPWWAKKQPPTIATVGIGFVSYLCGFGAVC